MKKKKQSLLWKITHPETKKASYVFGTMHVRDERAFRYKEKVEQKIMDCDVYASEVNLDEMNHAMLMAAMQLPEGQSLSTLLSRKVYQRLNKLFLKWLGMGLTPFDFHQPLFVTNILTESLLSADMPESLDLTLWEFARANEKITLGIESFAEQLEILNSISLKYQIKSLVWMTKNFKSYRRQLFKMTDLYEKGDIQQLYRSTRKQAKGMRKLMLFDRNELMADRIAKIAQEQSLFVSIGAGHLSGKQGVLRLLKQHGFRVKPIARK